MKNVTLLFAVILFSGITSAVVAQEKRQVTKELKSIKKEVRLEEENGEKVLTILTEENGRKTEERYKGKEADAKIAELNMDPSSLEKKTVEHKEKEVIVHENGQGKHVTITMNGNAQKNTTVYTNSETNEQVSKENRKKRKKAKAKLMKAEKK